MPTPLFRQIELSIPRYGGSRCQELIPCAGRGGPPQRRKVALLSLVSRTFPPFQFRLIQMVCKHERGARPFSHLGPGGNDAGLLCRPANSCNRSSKLGDVATILPAYLAKRGSLD